MAEPELAEPALPRAVQNGVVVGNMRHRIFVCVEVGEVGRNQEAGLIAIPGLSSTAASESVYPDETPGLCNTERELSQLTAVGEDARNAVLGHHLANQYTLVGVVANDHTIGLDQSELSEVGIPGPAKSTFCDGELAQVNRLCGSDGAEVRELTHYQLRSLPCCNARPYCHGACSEQQALHSAGPE